MPEQLSPNETAAAFKAWQVGDVSLPSAPAILPFETLGHRRQVIYDKLSATYIGRCQYLMAHPPGADWEWRLGDDEEVIPHRGRRRWQQ